LQVLADELGVGKGTLYRHFGNKQELFLAAADRVMTMLFRHIDAATQGIADPLDRIEQAIVGYLGFFETHPEAVEIFIQERAVFRDRKRPTYFVHREANVERWRSVWRDLIAAGRVRPLGPERITYVLGDQL
jgi:AcrR family transcriptional regulator